jgi:hypothetical protein
MLDIEGFEIDSAFLHALLKEVRFELILMYNLKFVTFIGFRATIQRVEFFTSYSQPASLCLAASESGVYVLRHLKQVFFILF